MRIGIFGYGYVGKGIARMFQDRADFIAVIDPHQLRNDQSRMAEVDIAFVCVPTPRRDDGSCNTSIVREVVAEWSDKVPLICIKSTVEPGTTEQLIESYGDHIHFSPEYMGEGGNYVEARYLHPTDARSHPFCIVGGRRPNEVLFFFQKVMATSARFIATTATAAELAKYMTNAYLATKVAFCNEFASISESYGVPYNTVRDLWLNDPRIDHSHTIVFQDNRGFGGKCLPKDVSAIRHAAGSAGCSTPLLDGVAAYDLERWSDK